MRQLQSANSNLQHLSVMSHMTKTKKHVDFFLIVQIIRRQHVFPVNLLRLRSEEITSHCYTLWNACRQPMKVDNLPEASLNVFTLSHLTLSIKLLKAGHFPNFTMKKSGSEMLVIGQSWADNPCLPWLQTHAFPTMIQFLRFVMSHFHYHWKHRIQNKTLICDSKYLLKLTANSSTHLDTNSSFLAYGSPE